MVQSLKLTIQGLYSHPNPLSNVPQGALTIADNLVIDRPGEASSRRGLKQFNPTLTGIKKFYSFVGKLLALTATTLYRDNASAWTSIGSLAAPTGAIKVNSFQQNQAIHFLSDAGSKVLDSLTGSLTASGVAPAIEITGALSSAGSGFFTNNTQVAYRVVFGRRDANGFLLLGAPSARLVMTNTSGSADTTAITFSLPSAQLSTDHFWQLYRSFVSVNQTADPGDELQLVIEKPIASGDLTAGLITFTDTRAEADLGALLYTSPSQDGIAQANRRPPLAVDAAEFKQCAFYANTKLRPNIEVTLIAQPTINDTFVITRGVSTFTYTAKALENVAAHQFAIGATLAATVESLIRVIARDTTNKKVFGYATDGATVFFEAAEFADTFSLSVTGATIAFNLATMVSSSDEHNNRVYISRQGLPQAVPTISFLDLGSSRAAVLRVIANRDAVFFLKEDGIFRVTGFGPDSFVAEVHDSTLFLRGPETAVLVDNSIFCMTTQGPVAIDLSGKTFIGRQIESELLQRSQLSNFTSLAYGISYTSDRKYMLAMPATASETVPSEIFVYSYLTGAWTKWPLSMRQGLVHSELLYLARAADDQALQERKAFTDFDFADDEYTVNITGVSGDEVTVTSVPTGVVVGMTLVQGFLEDVIVEIVGTTLTLRHSYVWSNGAATVYTPILNKLMFSIEAMDNPGVVKQLSDASYLFRDARFDTATALTASNFSNGTASSTLESPSKGPWGFFPWGEAPWGGLPGGFQALRMYFPTAVNMGHWFEFGLELEQAFNAFSFLGMSVTAEVGFTDFRISRGQ